MIARFNPIEGLVTVPAKLWGPSGQASVLVALDTGATRTLVSWDLIAFLGYDPASAPVRLRITTANSIEFAPQIEIEKIEALGTEVENLPIVCHTLPASASVDGLLGLDFLRGQRLTLDFREGTIALD